MSCGEVLFVSQFDSISASANGSAFDDYSFAINGHLECRADLMHPCFSKAPDSFDKDGDRDTFDRIQIHRRASWNGIFTWIEHHLARQSTDGRRAGSHKGAEESRDCGVS